MNYCTVFDSSYLSRALVCYRSLLGSEPSAHLYFFCLDEPSAEALEREDLTNCTVLRPSEFECSELRSVKGIRSKGEYAWTVKPYAISYVLRQFQVDECTYIDADLFFLSPPRRISDRFTNHSVILTPHNFPVKHDTSERNGIYSAQYISFRADPCGRKLLLWWKERCLEWCYARHEPGRYGDQKYLEHIAGQPGVAVADHLGFIGPWNVAKFEFAYSRDVLSVKDGLRKKVEPVIFFHFHGLKLINHFAFDAGGYPIEGPLLGKLYVEYVRKLRAANRHLADSYGVSPIDASRPKWSLANTARAARNWATRRYRLIGF